MKNKKAISPVLAVLLMIAVAVAAALITYAWVMTYLESTTSRAGHAIQIQSVAFGATLPGEPDSNSVTIYAQNVGDGTLKITDVYLDGALVKTYNPGMITVEGATASIEITGQTFESTQKVHIKVVCEDGTFTSGTYTAEFEVIPADPSP